MTQPTTAPPRDRLTPEQIAALLALVQAQAAIRERLTQTAIAAAVTPLRTFTAWWDSAAVGKLIEQILRVVQPAQRQAARATDAYLARASSILTGRTVRPVGAVDVTKLRRAMSDQIARELVAGRLEPGWLELGGFPDGPSQDINRRVTMAIREAERQHVEPGQQYGRIADAARFQQVAKGVPEAKARQRAIVRIAAVAETDVTLAVREQYQKNLVHQKALGYRRIIHPELSEHGTCGLCVVAADRVYHIEDLLPIHDRCRCTVLPVYAGQDPGLHLNSDDLQRIYKAAGGTGGAGLKKIRVALAEHGELGPTLTDAGQHYRGPVEVARMQVPDRKIRARAQLDSLEESLAVLLRRQAHGENVDKPIEWQSNRIAELRRELASA